MNVHEKEIHNDLLEVDDERVGERADAGALQRRHALPHRFAQIRVVALHQLARHIGPQAGLQAGVAAVTTNDRET